MKEHFEHNIIVSIIKLCSGSEAVSLSVNTPLDDYKQFAATDYCPYVVEGI